MTLSGPRTRMPSPRNLLARERRKRGRNRFPKPWPKTLTSSSLHPPMKYPSEKRKAKRQQSLRTRNHFSAYSSGKRARSPFGTPSGKISQTCCPVYFSSDRNSLASVRFSKRAERKKSLDGELSFVFLFFSSTPKFDLNMRSHARLGRNIFAISRAQ